ncbi:MAG: hypothetical protein HY057_09980 [Rhodospirillales bacterium]|nr:hypothetical protein [Rhodospirillales bacterium]
MIALGYFTWQTYAWLVAWQSLAALANPPVARIVPVRRGRSISDGAVLNFPLDRRRRPRHRHRANGATTAEIVNLLQH